MNQLVVGYARVSAEQQGLTAERTTLAALGVAMIELTYSPLGPGDGAFHLAHAASR